jgi:glutaryl-CoA dehydrogenase
VLDDCRLDDAAILPAASGLRAPLSCLDEARYGIVWGAAGAAQIIQQKLAGMLIAVNTSLMLALHLGRLKDEGRLHPEQVSFGKLHNVRAALEVARSARTVRGANGITLAYPVMRHLTNLESVLTYEGADEIHTLVLGQAITGLPAFR